VIPAMRRIDRYVVDEILRPFSVVLGILAVLFACFSAAQYLGAAVTETLGPARMLQLVLLKSIIALEVLVPLSLFLAVVIALGRLQRDREMLALHAAGISRLRVLGCVLMLAVPVSVLVALLSLGSRPWAYEIRYLLDARASGEIDAERIQAGRFYGNTDSGRVSYVQDKERGSNRMNGMFLYHRRDGTSEIILSRSASQQKWEQEDGYSRLHLEDGMVYRLRHDGREDAIVRFGRLVLLQGPPDEVVGYRRKAASTGELMESVQPTDIAELQWRLSRPISTLLLAALAVPLGRLTPRQGKHERLVAAALVFAVFYNLNGLAQSWVETGAVSAFPGVWWLPALMLALISAWVLPQVRAGDIRRP
jgi:lipopolysaccharide export system permease protein